MTTKATTSTKRRRRGQRQRGQRQSFKELVSLWVGLFKKHELLTYASAIAFQALVALVALVLLVVAILGEIGREDVWTKQIGPTVKPKLLPEVYGGIDATFQKIFGASSVGLIAFAAFLAIWEISGAVRVCMGAFSRIYETDDDRPRLVRKSISLGMAVTLTGALVGSILLATAGRTLVHGPWGIAFTAARWLLSILLLVGAFGVLVRYAPAERRTKKWASAGAAAVVVAWIVQSVIFWVYLRYLADYRTSVGSLLGIYFLTTYLYVAAIVLLVGIELDELLRKDLHGKDERGIIDIVRDVL
ncbi:MAG: rane protein [Gaiellaceae bacterium]|nr:rane protein [Gaiellaceae bacterium]